MSLLGGSVTGRAPCLPAARPLGAACRLAAGARAPTRAILLYWGAGRPAGCPAISDGRRAGWRQVPRLLVMGLIAAGLALLLAWLSVRTTIFAITDRRIVLRSGIAPNGTVSILPHRGLRTPGAMATARATWHPIAGQRPILPLALALRAAVAGEPPGADVRAVATSTR
jgi:hypothetical protein